MDVTRESVVYVLVVIVLATFGALVVALFDPFSVAVDLEIALPTAVGLGLLLLFGHRVRIE